MSGDKALLRRRLREHPVTGDAARLCALVLEHPWCRQADTVMAYSAFGAEPDLTAVLEEILRQGKRLVLPRCERDGAMTGRLVEDLNSLIPGVLGILEPGEDLPVLDSREIGLILVPGMAFDRRGGRLGRGKGYYDRFLSGYAGHTIGICWHEALLDRVPVEDHDIKMKAIATDREVLRCGTEGNAT